MFPDALSADAEDHRIQVPIAGAQAGYRRQTGADTGNLVRVLSFLDKQGLIQMHGAQICIEDGSKLTEITSMRDQKEPDQNEAF
jgi:hypothetical protein